MAITITKLPKTGVDATGADAYAAIVTGTADNADFHWLEAGVATKDAILSLDAGTTDHLYLSVTALRLGPVYIGNGFKSVYAKNATAGQNYATLWVNVWP